MRKRHSFSVVRAVLAVLSSLFAVLALPAPAQDRLPEVVPASSARVAIPNTVIPRARRATDLGAAPAGKQLTSITLRFNQTAAQSSALTQLLADQQNPSSARYKQWLRPEQFADEFGISAADAVKVSAWLEAEGLTVTSVARSRTFISFSGTVAEVNQAFGVNLRSLSSNGEQHIANLTDPTLPAAIARIVTGVTGLNDFRLKPHARPRYYGGTGYGNLVAPGDLYTIYGSKALIANSITGAGIKIAVVGQTDIVLSNVTAFRTAASLPTNLPTIVLAGTDPGTSNDDVAEAMIDVEWSGASAPSASIVYVNGYDVFNNSMTYAIDNDVAPIISVSYGGCEPEFGNAALSSYNSLFAQANAQGQTVVGPSGDSGAADCDYQTTYASQGLAVDFPGSSPYVTSVGGSEFDEGSGIYWTTVDGANAGTALSYIPEQPWNETYLTTSKGALFGLNDGGSGGGGVSVIYTKPAWQVGTLSDSMRDVPDLSLNGAADHDGYLVCTGGSCANGFAGALTNGSIYGGTSVAAPAFAGILALLEQKLAGGGLGNVNPTLYGLANSTYNSSVFHDITSGNNAVPCQSGSTDCSAGSPGYHAANTIPCPANSCSGNITVPSLGYLATTGFDLASGWGSVNAANLVADWLLVAPAGSTTTTPYASVTTAATATPAVTAGASVTVTATVASGTSASTAVPTGTVQLSVDGTNEGASVTLSSGAATLPAFATTNLSAGNHTFKVAYSGDGVYAASSGSVTVTVAAASTTLVMSTTTASTMTPSVAAGASVTITSNVASGSAASTIVPTGTVQLSVDGTNEGASVTLSGGAATLPAFATTNLAVGTHTFAVTYSGDSVYAASTGAVTITVTAATIADFSLTPANSSVSVAAGGTAPGLTFTVTPANGFTGSVAFTISGLPTNSAGTFTSNPLALATTAAGTTVLTVQAYGTTAALAPHRAPWLLGGSGAVLAGLLCFAVPRRRRRWSGLLVALVSMAMLSVAGCGSGYTAVTGGGSNAAPGTYALTITAASGTLTHTAVVSLVVQ